MRRGHRQLRTGDDQKTSGNIPDPETPGQVNERGVIDYALYVDGIRQAGERPFTDLHAEAQSTPGGFVWIGLHEPSPALLSDIARTFELHPLAVEDALSRQQRPKLERYEDVTFLVIRAAGYVEHAEITASSDIIHTGEVRLFVGEHFVVTVRQGSVGELASVRSDLEAHPELLAGGPWAVVHAVFDRMVDVYVEITAAMQADVDAMESQVFERTAGASIEHIYQLKRELMEFKQATLPLQRPLAMILDGRTVRLSKELRRYFRDVADHHTRVVDQVLAYDDLLNTVVQARLAQVTVDQNNDMRKIAAWAAIAAMQTAIAGIYGMNFTFMPELQWRYGYPAILTVMLTSAVVLYRYLRRAGWL
ncbi:magnesium/cobalt transporter CorA [Plantactinospora sp. CA-290183]|uniref:magnesium/cobalt transporter CorA n=1 Tax=Plantactinospora sp. CA-290183 TaxID=3240006 RepID=UPI003D910450